MRSDGSPQARRRWCRLHRTTERDGSAQSELTRTEGNRVMVYLEDNTVHCHDTLICRPTVKVAGVFLRLQVWNKLGLLSQQTGPVHRGEEGVLLHLKRPTWRRTPHT